MHPVLNVVVSLMEEVMEDGGTLPMKRAQIMSDLARALGASNVEVQVVVTMTDNTTDERKVILTADIDPDEYM